MEEKKVYKLLKDTVGFWGLMKRGVEVELIGHTYFTTDGTGLYFSKEAVENNPEWFELVTPKRIEMNDMMEHISKPWSELNWYQIHLTSKIDINKHYKQIKQAVENCLNGENTLFDTHQEFLKKYAEDTEAFSRAILEAEERAFNAGKEGRGFAYNSFSDYKNKTTKHE